MKRILVLVLLCFAFFSCEKKSEEENKAPIKMVFYPNESGETMKEAREAFKNILSEATGRPAEIMTTTDYNIALEALVSGKVNMAYVGAEGYIQAHNKNEAVIPLATNSGASGTLEDALYYSFIAVVSEKAEEYKTAGVFDFEKLRGKNICFVSVNSTSGFTVPAKLIAAKLKEADTDKLIEQGNVFGKVIFAGSHQGAQAALYRGDADVACFAIPQTIKVYKLISGEADTDGCSYEVQDNDEEPFSSFKGRRITMLKTIPVLNAPIVINMKSVTEEEKAKIQEALTSEQTANNPGIFKIAGSDVKGIFPKYTEKTKLIVVEDAWYDKVRNLIE